MAKTHKKWLSVLLCICLLTALLADGVLHALAATKATGTVFGINEGSYLSVRKEAATTGELIDKIYNDQVVTIEDTVQNGNITWYKITYTKEGQARSGYSSAQYIRINLTYETNVDFETHLTKQGFPEDYKVKLRQIHAYYPQWIFMADKLTMTWDTALKEESKVGRNTLINPDAWKSMEYGAYDWNKKEYVSFDSGGWVSASPAVIAYHMDPRNFLDTSYIYQFEDHHYSDKHTVEGVKGILQDAFDKYADAVLAAAKATGISAYHLATRMRQEGSHKNGLGNGNYAGYEGYYNFFHIGTYAHSGRTALQNGAIYAKNKGWNTPEKCIKESAAWIYNNYTKLGQDTTYYEKFNVVNTASGLYVHQYMSNVQAAASEGYQRGGFATDADKNSPIVFSIPVYMNMPQTVAPKPSTEGDNNNFLDSFTVKGYSLTPSFDRYTMSYSVHVGEATQVEVAGVANSKDASLIGGGPIQLYRGDNEITVTVTATSGEKRTYTVMVTTTGGEERPNAPVITGRIYNVSDTITKVEPDTALDKFVGNLAVSNGTAKIFAADGKQKTSGPVATGDILRLYSGNMQCSSYPILIYGDVNGDGKISSQDLRRAQRHILGADTVAGYYLTAADTNMDSKLSSQDLRKTQRYILGMANTLQPTSTTTAGSTASTSASTTSPSAAGTASATATNTTSATGAASTAPKATS